MAESKKTKKRLVILGAGASRSTSYVHETDYPSPLDGDFFDLLQRRSAEPDDTSRADALTKVLRWVRESPSDCWISMERAFYTLHLRAYLAEKLGGVTESSDAEVISAFATSIQALLRSAHGKKVCKHHSLLLQKLRLGDTIVTFNYDLIVERALRERLEEAAIPFGRWLYGFKSVIRPQGPILLKLHGSSNWSLDLEEGQFKPNTRSWKAFDDAPGYRGDKGEATSFPIFLPFWDKRIEEGPWLELWQLALERMTGATDVVVWGYSLPATDIKASHLFSLSLERSRRFNLCVIDPSRESRGRWRAAFPNALYWEYSSIEDFFDHPPRWWKLRRRADG